MIMAMDSWTLCADEVDEILVVRRGKRSSICFLGKKGRATDRAKCPHGRVDATGNESLGAFEEIRGM